MIYLISSHLALQILDLDDNQIHLTTPHKDNIINVAEEP